MMILRKEIIKHIAFKNIFYIKSYYKIVLIVISLAFIFIINGCKSYNVLPTGFIVQGDDNFNSVDKRFSVTIGADILDSLVWQNNSPPLQATQPTKEQKKVLKKLGYDPKNYSIVFTSPQNMRHQMTGLINTYPLQLNKSTILFDVGKLNRKQSKYAKWYDQTLLIDGKEIYHAIVPISEKLFEEKYLSIVYFDVLGSYDLKLIEEMVHVNAEKFRASGYQFLPLKTIEHCPNELEPHYFDYTVPQEVIKLQQYTLIKVYSDRNKSNLAYYSLLSPNQSLGSFKICKGKYLIDYTTLKGDLLSSEEIHIQ